MRNQRNWLLIVGALALLAAVGGGLYAYRFYDSLVTTAKVVTVSVAIPPYTLITADLLEERSVPRPILEEPVYRTPDELVGKVTTMALVPGQIIYRHQAASQAGFRYTDDPALEVVSFPVDPSKAVGGQVKIGHRINVYRVRELDLESASSMLGRPSGGTVVVTDPIGDRGAESEILAQGIQVVDVRARQGEPAGHSSASSQVERTKPESAKPLQILTVAVDPETAQELVELAVEDQKAFEIWVTLAPLQSNGSPIVAGVSQ
jgi:Flp pilus assembly protein CpaB